MEANRSNLDLRAAQERDAFEVRELLLQIVRNNDDMKALLAMRSPRVEEMMMESLQTVCRTLVL